MLPDAAKAVFIADRGFCSYNNMAHVMQRGQFFLFRAKDIRSKGLLQHIDFPSDDEFDVSVRLVIVRRQSKKLSLTVTSDSSTRTLPSTSLNMAGLLCLFSSIPLTVLVFCPTLALSTSFCPPFLSPFSLSLMTLQAEQ